jgi:hypothetical protein
LILVHGMAMLIIFFSSAMLFKIKQDIFIHNPKVFKTHRKKLKTISSNQIEPKISMKITWTLTLVSLLFSALTIRAHPNGQGQNDAARNRIWKLKDKSFAAEGSFYFFKEGRVFIYTINNTVVSFPTSELSWMTMNVLLRAISNTPLGTALINISFTRS